MKTRHTVGKVNSNEDGAKAGRVEIDLPEGEGVYPELFDAVMMSGWHWPPEPGENVLAVIPDDGEDQAEFADDVKYLGVVYDGENTAPDEFKENAPKARGFKTKAGHLLLLVDKSGSETFKLLEGKSGSFIEMTGLGELKLSNGKATITLSPGGGISITPGSPLELGGNTDALIKGTSFKVAMEAYFDAQVTQFTALAAASTGVLAPLAAGFTALATAATTAKATAANWLSAKSKTG